MKKTIRRLRLKPGDILLVGDHETAQRLMSLPGKHPFSVPIVITKESVKRLSLSYLQKLVSELKGSL